MGAHKPCATANCSDDGLGIEVIHGAGATGHLSIEPGVKFVKLTNLHPRYRRKATNDEPPPREPASGVSVASAARLVSDPSGALGQCHFTGADWADQYAPIAPARNERTTELRTGCGLLQSSFGWFGIGRFYIDSIGVAFRQLALAVFGLLLLGLS